MSTGSKILVVGAGISGLTSALRLVQAGFDVRVVDAADRPGGLLGTQEDDGVLFETAANGFLSGPLDGAVALAEELGVEMDTASSAAVHRWIVMGGRLVPLPRSLRGLLATPLLSRRGLVRALTEPLRGSSPGADESVYQLVARRFGDEVARNLVAPFVVGVFAGDARELSARAAFPMLGDIDRRGGVLRWALTRRSQGRGERPRLCAPSRGVGALIAALANTLGSRVELGTRCVGLERVGDRVRVDLDGRAAEEFDAVVLATPAPLAGDIVRAADPSLAELLATIPAVSAVVVHLVYHRHQIAHPLDGFGFLVAEGEPFPMLGCVFESSLWPNRATKDRVLVRCIVGGRREPTAVDASDGQLVERSHQVLERLLHATGAPAAARVVKWRNAIPQYPPGHTRQVAELERRAASHRVVLAGNAYYGVSVNDCIAGARRVVDRIHEVL